MQKGHQISAPLDLDRARNGDRGEHFGFAIGEGRILLLERLILFIEANTLEPEIECPFRHPHDHPVYGLRLPGLEDLKKTTFARVIT